MVAEELELAVDTGAEVVAEGLELVAEAAAAAEGVGAGVGC